MTKKFFIIVLLFISHTCSAQYNNLFIPDTLSGANFNLAIKDTFAQIVNTGNQTITSGINGKFLAPTLFMNKGDLVQMNVTNNLNDSTTLHWHGFHLPAVMDGGPHQVIPPGTVWQPYWTVTNDAATYWYHPHLHEMTEEQMIKGLAGLIIVRDTIESALALPRTYGVDDIPLILTDRKFNSSNQMTQFPYGDSAMVNMTLRPQYTVPAQVVRFRILDAAIERGYNLGFSDNRIFYVITSDGGLLSAPVGVTRYKLNAGERIEILVNLTGQNGTSVDLKAYNSTLTQVEPGGDILPANTIFVNALARIDFNLLHINVGAQLANPITAIPTTLSTVTTIPSSTANITRNLTISDGPNQGASGILFLLNNQVFNINQIDYTVPLNNTEIWQVTNSGNFGHPFHIHDVQFNILTVNGAAPVAAQAGWKDVVFVPAGGVVRFIAKFEDYADSLHPFMFHCHIALHEDDGMMGQFVVVNTTTGINNIEKPQPQFSLYPNPTNDRLYIQMNDANQQVYYIKVFDESGRTILMLPKPDISNGIDISSFSKGLYHLILTDEKNKKSASKAFIVK